MLKLKINAGSFAKSQNQSEANQLLNLLRELRTLDAYIEIIDFELFVIPTTGYWERDYQMQLLDMMSDDHPFEKKKATFFMKLDLNKLREHTRYDMQTILDRIAKSAVDIELVNTLQDKYVVEGEEHMVQTDIQMFLKSYITATKTNG